MKKSRLFSLGVIAFVVFGLVPFILNGADRVALVIGIDRYDHLPRESQLEVAVKDARLMADTLKGLNPPFAVRLLTDVRQRDAMESLTRFVEEAGGAECALVYFAGHGVEYHGSNFLLARDTNVAKVSADVDRMKRRLNLAALPLQALVDELDATGAQVKVVILDACRDNPLRADDGTGTRSVFGGTQGLAQVTPPSGTLIAYSADAGQQANDGLFTAVLARHLQTPGLPILEVFAATREEVVKRSTAMALKAEGVRHEPAEYTKLNRAGTRFSFIAAGAATPNPASDEMAKLREQNAAMAKLIEELEAKGQRVDALKAQLAAMEKAREDAEAAARLSNPEVATKSIPSMLTTGSGFPAGSTRGFTNTLGMKFVPVEGTGMLFCEHETRVKDYAAYAAANPGVNQEWKDYEYKGHRQTSDHPVVNVSWEDAKAFCAWLSRKEGKTYRLPTDHEWSVAVGIGGQEDRNASPRDKSTELEGYPWGSAWPPPKGAGNLSGSESAAVSKIDGYADPHPITAPVKSYGANPFGLHDLSGNVWEWCEDWYSSVQKYRVLRGGSWFNRTEFSLRSSTRSYYDPPYRSGRSGFRVVVEVVGG